MNDTITHQWNRLHADYTAAHHEYIRVRLARESSLPGRGEAGLDAHLAAKGRLASAQRAMHEFCEQHAELG